MQPCLFIHPFSPEAGDNMCVCVCVRVLTKYQMTHSTIEVGTFWPVPTASKARLRVQFGLRSAVGVRGELGC